VGAEIEVASDEGKEEVEEEVSSGDEEREAVAVGVKRRTSARESLFEREAEVERALTRSRTEDGCGEVMLNRADV